MSDLLEFGKIPLDIGLGIAGLFQGKRARESSERIARENLEYSKEVLDYEKAMQKEAWAREDNAVRRRVEDLKAAGINPLLAAGDGAASSSPIAVSTPHRDRPDYQTMMDAIEFSQRIRMERTQRRLLEQHVNESMTRQDEIRAKAKNTRLQNLALQQEMGMKAQLHPLVVGEKELRNSLARIELDVSKGTWENRIALIGKELDRAGLTNISISLDNQLRELGIDEKKLDLENLRRTLSYEWPLLGQNIRNDATLKYLAVEIAREELGMKQLDADLLKDIEMPRGVKLTVAQHLGLILGRGAVRSRQEGRRGSVTIYDPNEKG